MGNLLDRLIKANALMQNHEKNRRVAF